MSKYHLDKKTFSLRDCISQYYYYYYYCWLNFNRLKLSEFTLTIWTGTDYKWKRTLLLLLQYTTSLSFPPFFSSFFLIYQSCRKIIPQYSRYEYRVNPIQTSYCYRTRNLNRICGKTTIFTILSELLRRRRMTSVDYVLRTPYETDGGVSILPCLLFRNK